MRLAAILLILTGCASADYYNSDRYKIKQRQKSSMEMFETTREVRKKCSPRRGRPKPSKRKKYYS
jgi:outer membrane lipoprotein SlyB